MNGNISSLLEEKDQHWYFLCKEIELFERFTICSAPPVGFVAKDGFGEFRDFGQFWRAADDFARLVMLPCALPQTNLLRRRIGIVYVSVHTLILIIVSSWFEILTPLPKSVCINKARARARLTVMGIFYPNRPQIWKMRGRAKMVSLSHRRNVLIKEVDQYHLIAFFCWMCTAVHCTWGPPKIFLFCRWQMCPFEEKLLIYLSPYRNFLRRFLCLFYSRSDTVIYHAANKRICQVTDSLHLSNIDKLFSKKWLREVLKKSPKNWWVGGQSPKFLKFCLKKPVFGLKKPTFLPKIHLLSLIYVGICGVTDLGLFPYFPNTLHSDISTILIAITKKQNKPVNFSLLIYYPMQPCCM